jgi:hypothetical protein
MRKWLGKQMPYRAGEPAKAAHSRYEETTAIFVAQFLVFANLVVDPH